MTRKPKHPGIGASGPKSASDAAVDVPSGPPSNSPAVAALADKSKNLDALLTAVVDAANVSTGLWFSYLFVLFYLAIAAGGVTHRDLLYENPVRLPFLNVDLPLLGFFVLAPLLFLVVHAFVLLHFVLLAGKVGAFDAQLRDQIKDLEVRTRLRRQLPSNIFVQILAGSREVREGVMGRMLRSIAQISLVVGPVGLLVLFQLQFLPYHHELITWWHRIAVILDIILLWFLWPSVEMGRTTPIHVRDLGRRKVAWAAIGSFAPAFLVCILATFPGEFLNKIPEINWVPTTTGRTSLYALVIKGEVDPTSRRPTSLWPNSNRLVLPGLDVIDHAKFDNEEKIANLPQSMSLRRRHLEGAVLFGANLRKVDFTGARLRGASLRNAQLQGAMLDRAQLDSTLLDYARLDGASLNEAMLSNAMLNGANLQGASLNAAVLKDAVLDSAQLQAALLSNTQLQGASFNFAGLQGASLINANLQGATLVSARLQAVLFDNAQLQGALFDNAQLQGASLNFANLQKASLKSTLIWRVDVREPIKAVLEDAVIQTCWSLKDGEHCDLWTSSADTFETLNKLIKDQVPKGDLKESALGRIQRLDPARPLADEAEMEKAWASLASRANAGTPTNAPR